MSGSFRSRDYRHTRGLCLGKILPGQRKRRIRSNDGMLPESDYQHTNKADCDAVRENFKSRGERYRDWQRMNPETK